MASSVQVVEHVVLFKAREGIEQAATEAWMEAARALAVLDGVLYLYVGSVLSCKPADSGIWSIALYGRYRDKAALDAYAVHPKHLDVVALGSTIFSDVMALDWEAHMEPPSTTEVPPSSSSFALRVIFCQWKQHCLPDDIASASSWFHDLPHSSWGANFSPRSRGFEWGFAALSGCMEELKEDSVFLETLSKSSAVEKFLLVDIAAMEGSNVSM